MQAKKIGLGFFSSRLFSQLSYIHTHLISLSFNRLSIKIINKSE